MATNTPKLNLVKPTEITDFVDIDVINANMDTLDGKLGPITEDAWQAYIPTWTAAGGGAPTVGTGGNAYFQGRYKQVGKTVHGHITMRFGNTGISAGTSGSWRFGLPVPARAAVAGINSMAILGSGFMEDSTIKGYAVVGVRFPTGSVSAIELLYIQEAAPAGSTAIVGVTSPFAWAADDWLTVGFTYEAA